MAGRHAESCAGYFHCLVGSLDRAPERARERLVENGVAHSIACSFLIMRLETISLTALSTKAVEIGCRLWRFCHHTSFGFQHTQGKRDFEAVERSERDGGWRFSPHHPFIEDDSSWVNAQSRLELLLLSTSRQLALKLPAHQSRLTCTLAIGRWWYRRRRAP